MKKIFMGSLLVVSVAIMSCGGSNSPEVDKTIIPAESATPAAVSNTLADSSKPVQVLNAGSGALPVITSAPAKPAAAIKAGSSSAPNPAHGQPGHRCDIAVGAPLNSTASSPVKPQVQTVAAAPAPTPVVVTPTAAAAAIGGSNAKLNPAHGQPGHDCAIAVGAPLKKN